MSEIELHANPGADLAVQMDYARAVSSANLLPQAYRGKPADIMLAVGLGQAMGLSPAESLYRIDVIGGKPTASAELIAANVRKAGHKLRVRVDEAAQSATCTIVRADDPEFEHTVTRDRAWAEQMGLLTKDNYKKQAATMLSWRAITACARLACPEALYGVAYTPDEMADLAPSAPTSAGLGAALRQETVTATQTPSPAPDAAGSEPDAPPTDTLPVDAGDDEASAGEGRPFDYRSAWARGTFFPALRAAEESGHVTDAKAFMSEVVGRDVASSKELTEDEAQLVVGHLPSVEATS